MNSRVSADAHPRYLVATDMASFAIASVLLVLLSRLPSLFSPLALALLIVGLAVWFGIDIGIWVLRGIRSMELDAETLTLYRGRSLVAQRIERRSISEVRICRRLGRRTAMLRFPSGKRVRITEDAFPRDAFSRFLVALGSWQSRN